MSTPTGWSRRRVVASALSAAALAALPLHPQTAPQSQIAKGNHMTHLTAYLLFDGNCQEAMEFYKACFGGELTLTKVKDSPARDHMPAMQQNKTVNARLKSGNIEFSASDWLRLDRTRVHGNTVCLYVSGGTLHELKAIFEKLSEGAEITDPLTDVFYGAYGALNDRFGVRWMFQSNKPE
jgi:PhnB protein